MDFSTLDSIFTEPQEKREQLIFDWGQTNLLPLESKELEKAASQLTQYFLYHPQKDLIKNYIAPEHYWGSIKKLNHRHLNFGIKEYLLNILIYKTCHYITITSEQNLHWDFEDKTPRFIYKDIKDKKTDPNKKLNSGYSLKQKDIIWAGIVVGFLDVPTLSLNKKTDLEQKINSAQNNISSNNKDNDNIEKNKKEIKVKNKNNIKTNTSENKKY